MNIEFLTAFVVSWFSRRKKRCIRFISDPDHPDDMDDAVTPGGSSIPPAADSTTELFSPMPHSASSSSTNTDDIIPGGVGPSLILSQRLHHNPSGTADELPADIKPLFSGSRLSATMLAGGSMASTSHNTALISSSTIV